MKQLLYRAALLTVSAGLLISCKPKLDTPDADAGSLDVRSYVALGNSITSGYADAALYYDGQMVAYPNLMAEQFKLIGGGEFKQPLTLVGSAGIGGTPPAVNPKLVLGYKTDCKGVAGLSPVPYAASPDISIFTNNISSQGPFNNMGVPGAKSFHLLYPGYGTANPFFGRMTANPSSATILGEAAAQKPTFFSLFIGNNDVLSYALAGGAADSITQVPLFNGSIDAIVGNMTANGAKGIIGNIPDITALPYFTTIPYNGLVLTRQGQVDSLNFAYAQAGISFALGANGFIMATPAPPFVRKMQPGELVLLSTPQDSIKCAGWGSRKPLGNRYVLSSAEVAAIQSAVGMFNNKLKSVADSKGLAFVDVNAFMATCKKGIVYNGIAIGTTFVSGGAFSLDGVHLTPLGNALLANEFIKSINAAYGSTIPLVDGTKYRGVAFP